MWTIHIHITWLFVDNVDNRPSSCPQCPHCAGRGCAELSVDNVGSLDSQLNLLNPVCLKNRQLFTVNICSYSPQCPQTAQSRPKPHKQAHSAWTAAMKKRCPQRIHRVHNVLMRAKVLRVFPIREMEQSIKSTTYSNWHDSSLLYM